MTAEVAGIITAAIAMLGAVLVEGIRTRRKVRRVELLAEPTGDRFAATVLQLLATISTDVHEARDWQVRHTLDHLTDAEHHRRPRS